MITMVVEHKVRMMMVTSLRGSEVSCKKEEA